MPPPQKKKKKNQKNLSAINLRIDNSGESLNRSALIQKCMDKMFTEEIIIMHFI